MGLMSNKVRLVKTWERQSTSTEINRLDSITIPHIYISYICVYRAGEVPYNTHPGEVSSVITTALGVRSI